MKYDAEKFVNYSLFLLYITDKINKFFENQKEYIFCKKGCAKCCKGAQFPFTEIEFRYLLEGFVKLDEEIRLEILNKADIVSQQKKEFLKTHPKKEFRYDCPFLINNECSVYNFRGIICRSFGLMTFMPNSEDKPKIPFCAYEGMNYSNVLDAEKNNISEEKFKSLKLIEEPKAFNIDYTNLIDEQFGQSLNFEFGDVKPLIDWMEDTAKLPQES